jgi:hypothetical protein
MGIRTSSCGIRAANYLEIEIYANYLLNALYYKPFEGIESEEKIHKPNQPPPPSKTI